MPTTFDIIRPMLSSMQPVVSENGQPTQYYYQKFAEIVSALRSIRTRLDEIDTGVKVTVYEYNSGTPETHTYDFSTVVAIVHVQGGGGAAGGAAGTAAGEASSGGGGGAGGTEVKLVDVSAQGITSATVTVGNGGTGVTGSNGNNGSNSTYVDATYTVTGNGGQGGGISAATTAGRAASGGSGGGGSGGDYTIYGGAGDSGFCYGDTLSTQNLGRGGIGGKSFFGAPAEPAQAVATSASGGTSGVSSGYGAGGSGSYTLHGANARGGAAGGSGGVIILEFK